MNRNFFFLSLGVGAMLLAANNVSAQSGNCADHAAIVSRLASHYGESRQAMGLGSNNAVVEVFASDESGTWTITVTRPGGPTCLVAAGEGFQLVDEVLPTNDSGA